MKARHARELANFQKHMIESISNKPKFSKELLNLRRIQDTLARAKDYKEAHQVKMRADQLEAWELEKLRNSTQQGMYSKEAQFRRRQTNELFSVAKKDTDRPR